MEYTIQPRRDRGYILFKTREPLAIMETVYDCCANGFKVTTRKTMEDAEQLINKWKKTKAFDTSQSQSKCQSLK
jgi:hypothetical protein